MSTFNNKVRANVTPDLTMARAFIETLSGKVDEPATFQTFDDSESKRRSLARVRYGTLAQRGEELATANARGAGVFATINRCDGNGRRSQNVVELQALVTDDDAGTFVAPVSLPPNMTVGSKAGVHAYWLLSAGERIADFKPAQQAIARALGTDPTVCDPARVMRVPGFFHAKVPADPRLVTLTIADATTRRTIDQVLAGLGIELDRSPTAAPLGRPPIVRPLSAARLQDVLAFYTGAWRPGRRHYLALSLAAFCRHHGLAEARAIELLLAVAKGAGEPATHGNREWVAAVGSTYRAARASVHAPLAALGLALPRDARHAAFGKVGK